MAYICGVLVGDGHISYRERKKTMVIKIVGNPKDEKEFYWEVIGPKFQELFDVSLKIKYHDSKTTFGFTFFSKTIGKYLTEFIKLPEGRKYESLRVPEIFAKNKNFLIEFIRGVFDTDGCITFKKRYKDYPYYPVISLYSRSDLFIKDISRILKNLGFRIVESYNMIKSDNRVKNGYTIISCIEMKGRSNLDLWLEKIGFYSPKHLEKIKKYYSI